MKTNELIGSALDWAVSHALGHKPTKDFHSHGMTWNGWWETAAYIDTKPNEYRRVPKYSIDWSQGGPIIERERIELKDDGGTDWLASHNNDTVQFGHTPLIAAMRCFCASRLGDEVEVPDEIA